ncbi:MAG: hypothetical protein RBR28_02390 [Lentimicrobium sp.]|jgi:hypothetical protein|nr:hypothetical protein [Lentimicrobium sp.]
MAPSKSKALKLTLYYLKVFIVLILLFIGFSMLSSLIPDKAVRSNIENSLKYMENQPSYPHMIIEGMNHRPDYAMDGLITNIIYTVDNHDILKSSLLGRGRIDYGSPYASQWKWVKYNVQNNTKSPNFFYARYWHGNSYFFRIFYAFTDYNEIKWIIFMITSLLMALFGMLLYREMGALKALLLISGLFFMNVYVMQFSMQMSPVLIIAILMSFILIRWMHRKKNPAVLFFISGAVTTYFDLLTAPLLTLGIPMLIWVSLRDEENNLKKDLWSGFRQLVLFGLLWIVAYTGAWAMKMIVTIPFAELDIVADITNQFLRRAGSQDISRVDAIVRNFNLIPLVFINILLIIPLLLSPFFFNKRGLSSVILFIVVAALPYIWFFGAANHSYVHYWFTYRIQAITISGVLLAFYSLVDWGKVNRQWNKVFRNRIDVGI